jgi:acetyl esterase/lipase
VPALKLPSRLKGAVLISPWVSFDTTTRSFTDNAESDYLTVAALNRASSTFIGPRGAHDEYSEPVRAPPERWSQVASHVDEVLIWGGGGEILIDGIRAFANNVASGFAAVDGAAAVGQMKMNGARTRMSVGLERVFYVETPRASHEEQIVDHTLGIKSKNGTATVIEDWVCARL